MSRRLHCTLETYSITYDCCAFSRCQSTQFQGGNPRNDAVVPLPLAGSETKVQQFYCALPPTSHPRHTTTMVELPNMGYKLTDTMTAHPPHPFYPLGVEIVGYLANRWGTLILLGIFAAGCVVILGSTWVIVTKGSPHLRKSDKWAILWFILCKRGRPDLQCIPTS